MDYSSDDAQQPNEQGKPKEDSSKKRSKEKGKSHAPTSGALKRRLIIVAAIAAVVWFVVVPFVRNKLNPPVIITTTELMKAVNISDLSTAECVYNGIADKKDADGNDEYHIYYESRVQISMDMSAITFDVDQDKKTIRPILPELTIGDNIEIDTSTLDYLPKQPADFDLSEVVALCKQDARDGCLDNAEFFTLAQSNARSTVESLLLPLVEPNGYTIVWDAPATEGSSDGSAA